MSIPYSKYFLNLRQYDPFGSCLTRMGDRVGGQPGSASRPQRDSSKSTAYSEYWAARDYCRRFTDGCHLMGEISR